MKKTIVDLCYGSFSKNIELRIAQVDGEGDVVAFAKQLEFEPTQEAFAQAVPATTTLRRDTCQHLMDQLWYLGFRPEAGEMSVGQVAAVNAHLQDMRTLAFAQLRVPKP